MVVAQPATEALPAPDIANLPTNLVPGIDDPVPQALVVPLCMVVGDELPQRPLQRGLAEEDHPVEALGLNPSFLLVCQNRLF